LSDCAILTALNIADERFKEQESSENLRRQIKELLEEASQLKLELSECKRQIFKLSQKR
jgi:cell division protein ZapA